MTAIPVHATASEKVIKVEFTLAREMVEGVPRYSLIEMVGTEGVRALELLGVIDREATA